MLFRKSVYFFSVVVVVTLVQVTLCRRVESAVGDLCISFEEDF